MRATLAIKFAVLLSSIVLPGCKATDADIEKFVTNAGFVYNNPPSKLFGPGVLVFRRQYDPNEPTFTRVQLGALCESSYYIGKFPLPPTESPTASADLKNKVGGSFKVGLDVVKSLIGVQLKPELVREAQISIRQARVMTYSQEALSEIRDLLTPRCAKIVNTNIGAGNAYQIDQVLEASIDYTITFNAGATASANLNVISKKVEGTFELVDQNTAKITGSNLYYGVSLRPISEQVTPRSSASAVASLAR